MKELIADPNVKIKVSAAPGEAKLLAGLTALVNNPDFAENGRDQGLLSAPDPIPSATDQKQARAITTPRAAAPIKTIAPEAEDEGLPVTSEVITAPAPAVRTMPANIFTTGRLKVGKDHILKALGYAIHGFADPIYALSELCFGTADKNQPGVREFMQAVGQWGRGEINEQYRLTPVRAMFTIMIRSLAAAKQLPDYGVDWPAFGHENLWINALLQRLAKSPQQAGRNAVSNVRFLNEYEKMTEAGWVHFHVMCSQTTWEKRIRAAGMDPKSPALKDQSEHMAIGMDRNTLEHIKIKPTGPKLRVIWNDEMVKCPSPRLYTLAELGG